MSDSNSFWGACKSCATIHSPAPPIYDSFYSSRPDLPHPNQDTASNYCRQWPIQAMRASRSLIARWERTTSAHDVPASSDSAGEDAQMGQLRIWASGGRGTAGAVECSPGWKGEHTPTTPAILRPPPAAASRIALVGRTTSFVVRCSSTSDGWAAF